MANNFQIQRLKKNSKKLTTQGLDILGESLNNLSVIYNINGNSYHPYVQAGDGVYIGKNPVANTTRAYYTNSIERSLEYNVFNFLSGGAASPPPGSTISDVGTLHLIMPADGLTDIYSGLNFRSLADASTSFGDVNKVIKWGITPDPIEPSSGVEDPSTPKDPFSDAPEEIRNWAEAHAEDETITVEPSITSSYVNEDGETVTREIFVVSTKDKSSAADLLSSERTGNTEEDADKSSTIANSLTSIDSLTSTTPEFTNTWTKTLTNAYGGIISNIKWDKETGRFNNSASGAATKTDGAITGWSVDESISANQAVMVQEEAVLAKMTEYKKLDDLNSDYIDNNKLSEISYSDLFGRKEEYSSTVVNYTGPVMNVDERVWKTGDETYVEQDAVPVKNATDTISETTYTPTNVWDEINYRFKVINDNFRVLTADIDQTNIMIMEDTVGKLIPAVVTTTSREINAITSDVGALNASIGWYNVSNSNLFNDHPTVIGYLEAYANNIAAGSDIDLSDYVTTSALTRTLRDYITGTSLTSTLNNYVTTSALSTTLNDYVTTDTLDLYVTLNTEQTITGKKIINGITEYRNIQIEGGQNSNDHRLIFNYKTNTADYNKLELNITGPDNVTDEGFFRYIESELPFSNSVIDKYFTNDGNGGQSTQYLYADQWINKLVWPTYNIVTSADLHGYILARYPDALYELLHESVSEATTDGAKDFYIHLIYYCLGIYSVVYNNDNFLENILNTRIVIGADTFIDSVEYTVENILSPGSESCNLVVTVYYTYKTNRYKSIITYKVRGEIIDSNPDEWFSRGIMEIQSVNTEVFTGISESDSTFTIIDLDE